MKKFIFSICVLCSTSVTAADMFLCEKMGVLFEPEKSVGEYCSLRTEKYEECVYDYFQEKEMYEKGKCLPVAVKEYIHHSPKYQDGVCAIKIFTVQVQGEEYMVKLDSPCSFVDIPTPEPENLELVPEEEKKIDEIYRRLPGDLYPKR